MPETRNRITLIENDEFWKYEMESEQICFLCGNKIRIHGFDFFGNMDRIRL